MNTGEEIEDAEDLEEKLDYMTKWMEEWRSLALEGIGLASDITVMPYPTKEEWFLLQRKSWNLASFNAV